MKSSRPSEVDLRRELDEFHERYPKLANDDLFVLWFLRAFIAEDEAGAVRALCGGSNDKHVDAVLIDDNAKIVFIVQGKYRQKIAGKNEQRAHVIGFAQLAAELTADEADLKEVYDTERHLLYVACTRARDYLHVSGVNPASEFLDDLSDSSGAGIQYSSSS